MNCQQAAELVDAHALGALDRPERRRLEAHLQRCPRCRQALAESEQVAASLPLSLPVRRAHPDLFERILLQMDQRRRGRGLRVSALARPLVAAGAAVLVAAALTALGLALSLQRRVNNLEEENESIAAQAQQTDLQFQSLALLNDEMARMVEQQRLAALALFAEDRAEWEITPGSGEPSTGEALYVWSRTYGVGVLTVRGLAPLPPESTYQLWFASGPEFYSGGTFEVRGSVVQHVFPLPEIGGRVTMMGVTVEPAGGSQEPTGQWVLRSVPPTASPGTSPTP